MSGPFHDFLLLSLAEHPFTSYGKFVNDPRAVRLHDDLVGYIWDTLAWLPSYNPAKKESVTGLCRWGPTIIAADGAATACRIFAAWADLLGAGPPLLRLDGEWTYIENETPNEGRYERLEFDRDETVARFRLLSRFAEEVTGSGHDLYILHLGV